MVNKEFKKETLATLEVMIANADKGPSGFWVDDYEGCGNPRIFPEFDEGLKKGRLVQKNHYLCPWNTAVLFGEGHGNIQTGCYHSCSIKEAKYLSAKMIKDVLLRFKKMVNIGIYDNPAHLKPLLTEQEISFIEQQVVKHTPLISLNSPQKFNFSLLYQINIKCPKFYTQCKLIY